MTAATRKKTLGVKRKKKVLRRTEMNLLNTPTPFPPEKILLFHLHYLDAIKSWPKASGSSSIGSQVWNGVTSNFQVLSGPVNSAAGLQAPGTASEFDVVSCCSSAESYDLN